MKDTHRKKFTIIFFFFIAWKWSDLKWIENAEFLFVKLLEN